MKKYLCLQKWDFTYNGAGIYYISDEQGKKYIGRAIHIQDRLHQHRRALNRAAQGMEINCVENQNLINIAKNGGILKAEILYKLQENDATENNFRFYENFFFNLFGGYKGTYNIAPIYAPVWNYKPNNEPLKTNN